MAHRHFADIETELATTLHMGRDGMIVAVRNAKQAAIDQKAALNVEFDSAIDRFDRILVELRSAKMDEACGLPDPVPPTDERTAEQIAAMFAPVNQTEQEAA